MSDMVCVITRWPDDDFVDVCASKEVALRELAVEGKVVEVRAEGNAWAVAVYEKPGPFGLHRFTLEERDVIA